MKIVIPVLSLETGGTRFIYQVANELEDRGHQVEIVLPCNAAIAWPLRTRVTWVDALAPHTIPEGDFILPNFWPTVMPAWESKKGRVVRLSLGYEPMWVSNPEAARLTYLIDAPIISISQWQRQLILEGTGRDSTVIPGGVDHKEFYPQPKWSEATGRMTLAYILRSREHGYTWKGWEEFTEACRLLQSQGLQFDIKVVSTEGATYPSPVPYEVVEAISDVEMARFYAKADIFVSTSYFESFSLPSLEAMACCTAVVTTDSGGNREYAKDGQNCMVVPPGNVGELVSALGQLLTQHQFRNELAHRGYQMAQPWTWKRTADQVEALLLSLK